MFSKDLDKPIVIREGNCLAFELGRNNCFEVLVLPKKDSPKIEAFSWSLRQYSPAKTLLQSIPSIFIIKQISSALATIAGLEPDFSDSCHVETLLEGRLLIVPLCEPAAVTARKILKKK
jgi:hypothetical protein